MQKKRDPSRRSFDDMESPNIHSTTIRDRASKATKRTSPHHLTLLGLPDELRDQILSYVFENNGAHYVKQQLLGFPKQDYSTYSHNFRILLTSRQIYAEGFQLAYRLSCFYWFKSYKTSSLERLCLGLSAAQARNVRHLAFWSNPYLYEDFMDDLPSNLTLTRVTVCSNYMSGVIPTTTILGRQDWIIKNIRQLETLTSFHFLTGNGIGACREDCGFAEQLRAAFEGPVKDVEVGGFDPETRTTKIALWKEDGSRRIVDVKVASVFEKGFDSG